MPTTYNGIGTHYYGKKNRETRPGLCDQCGQTAELASYDTRLWFVILFIPIIPLGRKRLLDYCSKCTRHRVLDLKDWEKLKAENISEGMAKIKASPNDPQAVIEMHSRLVAFGQTEEADKLMILMRERFARDAKTQAYLGSVMQYLGRYDESAPFFQRALEIDPGLPEAKIAVGLHLVNSGRLEEARKLLKFLEAPDAPHAPGVLFALAEGYQKANRHQEALELFTLLSTRIPEIAQDKQFRKAVKKSETNLPAWQTKLPARRINYKPVIAIGAIAGAAVIGALIWNHYISGHRTLYVVNGYEGPVSVSIDSADPVKLHRQNAHPITLPEGNHRAQITGAVTQNVDFTIESRFWRRWFDNRVFVLNPGGAALLIRESIVYSSQPTSGGSIQYYFGKPFLTLGKMDYLFEPFPESIQVSSGSASSITKWRIDLASIPPADAFYALVREEDYQKAQELGEWYLRLNPKDTGILPTLAGTARMAQREDSVLALVKEAVKRRPIEIEWHRMYQELRSGPEDYPAVLAEYDALLLAAPEDSDLLYLRGRIAIKKSEAIALYQRAITHNPDNAYAHYALGMNFASAADWSAARTSLMQAVLLDADKDQFRQALFEARLATDDLAALESDLQAQLANKPLMFDVATQLYSVLLAAGKKEDADKLAAEYEQTLRQELGGYADQYVTVFRLRTDYLRGDLEALLKTPDTTDAGRLSRFYAEVEVGRVAETAALAGDSIELNDPFDLLAVSVAWRQAGDAAQATNWQERAIKLLATGRAENVTVGEILKGDRPTDELFDIGLRPREKAICLVALAQELPEQRTEYLAAARKLNVSRQFPYYLLQRLTSN